MLDDLILRLQRAGILVLLGIHTLTEPESNGRLWCESSTGSCADEAPLRAAWATLAGRYCASANVLGADLYNEPWGATWGTGDAGTDWDLAAARLGNGVLESCPRWLIFVQGIGGNSGQCRSSGSGADCWCKLSLSRALSP